MDTFVKISVKNPITTLYTINLYLSQLYIDLYSLHLLFSQHIHVGEWNIFYIIRYFTNSVGDKTIFSSNIYEFPSFIERSIQQAKVKRIGKQAKRKKDRTNKSLQLNLLRREKITRKNISISLVLRIEHPLNKKFNLFCILSKWM